MLEHGFLPDFSAEIRREVAELPREAPRDDGAARIRDLRQLPWSSIDNPESRDLDQIEVAETLPSGVIKLLIGVADVDVLVKRGSATDARAANNTTSVYTGVAVFPMLPRELSEGLTSLNPAQDRLAVVIELEVSTDGEVVREDVYRALVHNHAKLDYLSIGDWLEDTGPMPEALAANQTLHDQVRLQYEASLRLRAQRVRRGSLSLETLEARPVMADGKVIDIEVTRDNPAREIIESFMVAANGAMARFLQMKGVPSLRRVVRVPKRWDRIRVVAEDLGVTLPAEPDRVALSEFLAYRRREDPMHFPDLSLTIVKLLGSGEYVLERRLDAGRTGEGHFGIAAAEYTHSTAPNRRFPDLITQRLMKSVGEGTKLPYTEDQLMEIATRCTEMEDESRKVERIVRKKAAAMLMMDRIGEEFTAIVTGASPKGTYVRVLAPAVEGRVTRGFEALDVGDTVRVRLTRADPDRGFIDFETATEPSDVGRKVERMRRKRAMAAALRHKIGETFRVRVTGASEKGVWVRALDGSAEGKVVRGSGGLALGDEIDVTLVDTDTVHGFIDFEYAAGVPERKRERAARKRAAASKLRRQIGKKFEAEVTGVTPKATWIRTLGPEAVEGRLVRGWRQLETGDRIHVQLLHTDPQRGFIDFGRATD